jgi:hypothetical protein
MPCMGAAVLCLVIGETLTNLWSMKRLFPLILLSVACVLIVVPFAWAADPAKAAKATKADRSPAAPIATTISAVTGMAISPLLGTGAYGAYQWMSADEATRASLPWYAHWGFFVPALLLVGACAAKDAFGAVVPPGLKKPLDVLELVENKASALVAAGAVVPFTMASLAKMIGTDAAPTASAATGGLAMVSVGAIDWSPILSILTIPFGIAMFVVVWMASHAITVLILLSPWGAIDAALKSLRTALLGLLTLGATINPWIGALLSLVVIVIAYLVAGWAFRLTCFGSIFCWDFCTGRKGRFTPADNGNTMFAGRNFPDVPVRTYGQLVQTPADGLEFHYRPWLVLPVKTAKVPAGALSVGRGLFVSTIVGEGNHTLFLLPPRYRGHEEALARLHGFAGGVTDAGLRKAWSALKELFSSSAVKTGSA